MSTSLRWSKGLAYAVGLITTDGSLSIDKRHLSLVSKDIEQINTFAKILKLKNKISLVTSIYNPTGDYFRIQFGNVRLYSFLVSIGLSHNKTFKIGELTIPPKYFVDFLRGHLDGDGNISIVKHPESQYPQLRIRFLSASNLHLIWLKNRIEEYFSINTGFYEHKPRVNCLTYAKRDSLTLLDLIYYDGVKYYLKRKFLYYKKVFRPSAGIGRQP